MIKIEEARNDCIEQMAFLEEANFTTPWTKQGLLDSIHREDTIYLVAYDTGHNLICGYCGLWCSLDEAELVSIVIDNKYRRRGIGLELLQNLGARAKKMGICKIFLEVRLSNEKAICLYEKMGFIKIGIRKDFYEQPVEDGIVMEWYIGKDEKAC